jgi:uncharacterized protein DUF3551
MVKSIVTFTVAAAAFAAGLFLSVPASQAIYFGDAPWCAVTYGGDDVHWSCEYRTGQECVQALAGGIRGSCNVNPWPNPSTPAAATQPRHRQ